MTVDEIRALFDSRCIPCIEHAWRIDRSANGTVFWRCQTCPAVSIGMPPRRRRWRG